jgi:Domain of unknown function (DUF4153)
MKFPSIAALAERARFVLVRFPWPLAAGLVAAIAAIVGVDAGADEEFWARLTLVAMLAIPLTTALSLLAERNGWSGLKRTGPLALGVLALIWFFQTWDSPEQKHLLIRYLQLSAVVHLMVAFLPFWGTPEHRGFWTYNRRLFEGFLRAVVFSGVLFVGLAIALGALDKLFGVDVEGETYIRLWFFMAFLINTWIFLAGVPDDLDADEDDAYPRALKVFTQYILTPLVAVYLLILLAYLVKILVTGTWPSGWIGYLVSSVAVTGILGFLLVHPLRARATEGWIRTYSRWLYVGLIPAAAMFLLAVWQRVQPYGLTELRFLGLLLGGWLLGIAVLYTIRREAGIRIIPVSLAIIALVTAFGPLSATSMSVRSQEGRVRRILEANQLAEGAATGREISPEDRKEMSEALRFLLQRNAVGAVQRLFAGVGPLEPLPNPYRGSEVDSTAARALASVGVVYLPEYYYDPYEQFSLDQTGPIVQPIAGFDYLIRLDGHLSIVAVLGPDTISIVFDSTALTLSLLRRQDSILVLPLAPLVNQLIELDPTARNQVSREITAEREGVRGLLVLGWLGGQKRDGRVRVNGWRGDLYLVYPTTRQ